MTPSLRRIQPVTDRGSPGHRRSGAARRQEGRGATGSRTGRGVYLGRAGEDAAVKHLEGLGFRVVERNYRNRLGEIDAIAVEGETLCFVEVKARRVGAYGSGLDAVESKKRGRVRRAAAAYLARFGPSPPACRFDVVEVWLDSKGRPERVRLLRNAF